MPCLASQVLDGQVGSQLVNGNTWAQIQFNIEALVGDTPWDVFTLRNFENKFYSVYLDEISIGQPTPPPPPPLPPAPPAEAKISLDIIVEGVDFDQYDVEMQMQIVANMANVSPPLSAPASLLDCLLAHSLTRSLTLPFPSPSRPWPLNCRRST